MTGPFTSAERQRATHVGLLRRKPGTDEWAGSISMAGSLTSIVLVARPEQLSEGGEVRLAVLGRLQDTREQREIKRAERRR